MTTQIAPGSRIVVRDAEWIVRRIDLTSSGDKAIRVHGLSELVKDTERIFLEPLERNIEVLDPAATRLVPDQSSGFAAAQLFIESHLRQSTPSDQSLYRGHLAAMDPLPYQLDPALKALSQPRQRILIADAVGLGKTLEAGILLSELIKRGKGKRILILTVKSMLAQFQKEMWTRFSLPFTRLDSIGIKRIRSEFPQNHNPFYYYDRAIVSIDTLKGSKDFQTHLETAYWDVIVIDEAQNVAPRGSSSLRNELAELLSNRSDTMIMLSATPHDGKAKSFAGLMNMLDPTAIANPESYGPEDIQGLFIRRFKKDIEGQLAKAFQPRQIHKLSFDCTPEEEAAYDELTQIKWSRIDQKARAGELFKTTLSKALFSSPNACHNTIQNRINRLKKENDPRCQNDIQQLEALAEKVKKIHVKVFSKYQFLLQLLQSKSPDAWNPKNTQDRLVIFTERIDTLHFLHKNLLNDLNLKENQIAILHGTMPDVTQQEIVEAFGNERAPLRLLIASDVASEGINLHFLSHRLIHFDIPWSLMVFQQRNGRIDRYGQSESPQITYLLSQTNNPKIRGDMRILDLLIQKDEQAQRNIGDPSAFMAVFDEKEEELLTGRAMENNSTPEDFAKLLEANLDDPLAALLADVATPTGTNLQNKTRQSLSLFANDFEYATTALKYLGQQQDIKMRVDEAQQTLELEPPTSLKHRFQHFPRECMPKSGLLSLTARKNIMLDAIAESRKSEESWPAVHFLWEQHPVMDWINDTLIASFNRHEAPVIWLHKGLRKNEDESVFIISGVIPNRKGHPLIEAWMTVSFWRDQHEVTSLEDFVRRTGFGKEPIPNRQKVTDLSVDQVYLRKAVKLAKQYMSQKRAEFEAQNQPKMAEHLNRLNLLKDRQEQQLELIFQNSNQPLQIKTERKKSQKRLIENRFQDFETWIRDTMQTEDNPYIKVIAMLRGEA